MNSINYKLFLNYYYTIMWDNSIWPKSEKYQNFEFIFFIIYHNKKRKIYVQSKERSIGRSMTMHKIVNTWLDNRHS